MMREVELLVIGGGAAGMAVATSARNQGIEDILIIERNGYLGGVLRQCIHNGFGLHRFKEDLTGVEFARKYRLMVEDMRIPYMLNTFVISMNKDRIVTVVHPDEGVIEIKACAIVLAMGCRERTRNNLLIPGTRGAGIITAGAAQKYLNVNGYLPGKRVVILGSGDIGLIMARQFIMVGAKVHAVIEIMPYSSGLPRNMKQCIEDFNIPVYYNSTVTEIRGKQRVTSVVINNVDNNRQPIKGTEKIIECDTLMISAGLIPENELTEQAGIDIDPATRGAIVTNDMQTSLPGVFACGNVLHVHDLVDFVSEESEEVGKSVAQYLKGASSNSLRTVTIKSGAGTSGVVPQKVQINNSNESVNFMFRPRAKYRDVKIVAKSGNGIIFSKPGFALTPGEMIRMSIPMKKLHAISNSELTISIEDSKEVK